jgi:hypothetical protein
MVRPHDMTKSTNIGGTAPLGSSTRGVQRVRRFLRGRVCAEEACSTMLSTYNGAAYCWGHEAPRKFRPRPSNPHRWIFSERNDG